MKRRRDKGWIYIIGAHVGMDSLVKIGFTAGSAEKRMHTLQLGSPVELCVVTTFRGTRRKSKKCIGPLLNIDRIVNGFALRAGCSNLSGC
jgi:hypothetical protein